LSGLECRIALIPSYLSGSFWILLVSPFHPQQAWGGHPDKVRI